MSRNLKLAFLASTVLMAAPGCLGDFHGGTPGTPGTPANNGGAGGTGGGGGGGGNVVTPVVDMATPPPAAPSSAKPEFDSNVAPIIMAKCATSTCHGGTTTEPPPFAAGSAATLYSTVLNYANVLVNGNFDPTQSQILLKIEPGNHNGATYSATDIMNITNWENAERTARANTDGGVVVSPADALLAKWSGCMQLTEFTAANFSTTWAQKQATTGQCQQCHDTGGNGFLAVADSATMFSRLMQKNPYGGYFLQDYFTVDTTTDPTTPKIIVNTALLMKEGGGYAQHGTFSTSTNDNAMTVLQNYYTTTMAHLTANTCGASQLAQ
jgi:hypothetical protein